MNFKPLDLFDVFGVADIPRDASFEGNGGEGGIRTPDTLASMPHFECGAIDHSATSPHARAGA